MVFAIGNYQPKYEIKIGWSISWFRFSKMEEIKWSLKMVSSGMKLLFFFFFRLHAEGSKELLFLLLLLLFFVNYKSVEYRFFLTFFAAITCKLFTGQQHYCSEEALGIWEFAIMR